MSPRDNQTNVARAIESGQLWRAKEILSGRVGTSPFDAKLYEQFGALLLRMGDEVRRAAPVAPVTGRSSARRLGRREL
jgi:hypothetical protein